MPGPMPLRVMLDGSDVVNDDVPLGVELDGVFVDHGNPARRQCRKQRLAQALPQIGEEVGAGVRRHGQRLGEGVADQFIGYDDVVHGRLGITFRRREGCSQQDR